MTAPRVLVVDPDASHREHCRSLLDRAGFDVRVCASPGEAGAAAGYAAAFVDDGLDGDGVGAVAGALRRVGVPVFGMTSIFVGPLNRELVMSRHGVADYWVKPVVAESALAWLQRICGDAYPEPPVAAATMAAFEPDAMAARLDRNVRGRNVDPNTPDARGAVYSPSQAESAAPTGPVARRSSDGGVAPAEYDEVPAASLDHGGVLGSGTALDIPRPLVGEGTGLGNEGSGPSRPRPSVLESATQVGNTADAAGAAGGVLGGGVTRAGGVLDGAPTRSGGSYRPASLSPVIPVRSVPGEKLPRGFLLSASQRAVQHSPPPQPAVMASDGYAAAVDPRVPDVLNVGEVPWVGDLTRRGLATVLAALAYNQSTGALVLERGDDRRILYVSQGLPLSVAGPAGAPTLFDMLGTDGLITPEQRYELHHLAAHGRGCAGKVLASAGIFEVDDVIHLEGVYVRRRMLDVFEWPDGAYTFREGDIPDVVHSDPPIGPMDLIWDGVQHGVPLAAIRAPMDPFVGAAMVWLNEPPTPEDMEMTASQESLMEAIDGQRSIHALTRDGFVNEAAERFLYVLLATGFLGFAP